VSAPGGDRESRPLPPQATMGLLNYLTATALDEDYAQASRRREAAGSGRPTTSTAPRGSGRRRHGRGRVRSARYDDAGALAALTAFGVLVATAAVETSRTAPLREQSQESLVNQVRSGRVELQQARIRVAALRETVDRADEQLLESTREGRMTRSLIDRLEVAAGTVASRGPGVRVVVDDAPDAATDREVVLDRDLQVLVNGLWASGAEAVAVNRQRLTALSAIREAGSAITVNKVSLTRPYVVTAIGDPAQLPARLLESDAGTWWLNLQAVYGLRFSMSSEDSVTLPAAPPVSLRHARVAGPGVEGSGRVAGRGGSS